MGVLSFTQGDTLYMEEEEIALRVTINTPTETAEDYMKRLERDRLFPDHNDSEDQREQYSKGARRGFRESFGCIL